MGIFRKTVGKTSKENAKKVGTLLGNTVSVNTQNATDAAFEGMNLFRWKVDTPIIQNGHFDAQKGNLFEYIEAAKFNIDAASKGMSARAVVTDTYDPQAPADILINDKGKTQVEVQAKFFKSTKNGKDSSAADSVYAQKGKNSKYKGMQRLIRKDEHYNSEGSLLDKTKKLAKNRAESGNIYAEEYKDVYENLTDELHYQDASSRGTTFEEVREAYDHPEKYARKMEKKQAKTETKCTAVNMAKASFVTTGIASGATNMLAVFKDKKKLSEALTDVGVDAVKGGIRGGTTGVISSAIRHHGLKRGSALLSDSTAATVMAGSVIDGGVALYSYARGEIDARELRDQLIDTTIKSAATIYFTKAAGAIFKSTVSPLVPMVIYTAANYVITCTREIIRNANLNAEAYDRMTAILQESIRQAEAYRLDLEKLIAQCELNQRQMFERFLDSFEYNLETGENYDHAIYSIVRFANEAGMVLQHVKFDEFKGAMQSKDPFVLG